ncbi:hypothetical protein ACPDIX_14865, partial [Limisphaera sp. 4302-co]
MSSLKMVVAMAGLLGIQLVARAQCPSITPHAVFGTATRDKVGYLSVSGPSCDECPKHYYLTLYQTGSDWQMSHAFNRPYSSTSYLEYHRQWTNSYVVDPDRDQNGNIRPDMCDPLTMYYTSTSSWFGKRTNYWNLGGQVSTTMCIEDTNGTTPPGCTVEPVFADDYIRSISDPITIQDVDSCLLKISVVAYYASTNSELFSATEAVTNVFHAWLADEYTTARLQERVEALSLERLPDFASDSDGEWQTPWTSVELAADQSCATATRCRWRARVRGTIEGERYRIRWTEVRYQVADGKTSESRREQSAVVEAPGTEWWFPQDGSQVLDLPSWVQGSCSDGSSGFHLIRLEDFTIEWVESDPPPPGNGPGPGGSGGGCGGRGGVGASGLVGMGCRSCGTDPEECGHEPHFILSMGRAEGGGDAGGFYNGGGLEELLDVYELLFTGQHGQGGVSNYTVDVTETFGGQQVTRTRLSQVVAPEAVANVDPLSNGAGYQISFYKRAALTSQFDSELGRYVLQNPEANRIVTWTIENPDAGTATNRVRIRESRPGAAERVWLYTYDEQEGRWTLLMPDGQTERRSWQTFTNASDGSLLRTLKVQWLSNGQLQHQHEWVYQKFSWGEGLVQETVGAGSDAQTTTYTYHDPGSIPFVPSAHRPPLRRTVRPDGSWEEIVQYDSEGRPLEVRSGRLDQAPDENLSTWRTVQYDYTPLDPADDGSVQPQTPRTTVELVDGWEVARTYTVYSPTGTVTLRVAVPGQTYAQALQDSRTEKSIVVTDPQSGRTVRVHHPDGTVTLYQRTEQGGTVTETTSTGQPDDPNAPANIVNGQRTRIVKGAHGEVTLEQTYRIVNGQEWLLQQRVYTGFDDFHRPTEVSYPDDTTETFSYDCCGLASQTDREGVTTIYLYDALRRPIGHTRNGVTWSNRLDAAGRVLVRYRTGRDGTTLVLERNQYDTAGRLIRQTNALGGVTTWTYGT